MLLAGVPSERHMVGSSKHIQVGFFVIVPVLLLSICREPDRLEAEGFGLCEGRLCHSSTRGSSG